MNAQQDLAAWTRECCGDPRRRGNGWPSSTWTWRAGTMAALAKVVKVFGRPHAAPRLPLRQTAGQPHEVLVHDGIGVWLAQEP